MQKLTPVADQLLINPIPEEKGKIILDEKTQAKLNPVQWGTVVLAGPGTPENPMSEFGYGKHEVVLFPKGSGVPVYLDSHGVQTTEHEGHLHFLVNYDEIIGMR